MDGASLLPKIDVENAVYPYLGPGRTPEDVEKARAALEAVYQAKGYQTVSVQIPPQQVRGGIVMLQVTESKVGRLRVKGSRYFNIENIKKRAPSLREGKVPNFNEVSRDIVALNQLPDRRITPALRAGAEPGTVDIDLNVKDTLPLHGNVELNNRYTADTKPLRLNASLSYNNLWQLGHSIGASMQISPERESDVKVFSGYYLARFPGVDWLSVMLTGTKQDSNVNTLGTIAVAGRGETFGGRVNVALPPGKNFYHSASFGLDYKHFNQNVTFGLVTTETPISYYPLSASYSATWIGKGYETEFNGGVTFHPRGMGSDPVKFDNNRFGSTANFIYFRGDISHTHDLPRGFEAFARVQGQISDQPLINSEQFAGGGLGTTRGYLEATTLGDNALFGTLELRSPSLLGGTKHEGNEWRVYVFADGGVLTLNEPLPEQEDSFSLASIGFGTRLQILGFLNGSIDVGLPLIEQAQIRTGEALLTFRAWAEF